MTIANDELGVRSDIHHRDEPIFVRQVDGQQAGRGVRADVAADDREAVDAGVRWIGRSAVATGRRQARRVVRLPSAISISLIDR